MLRSSREKQRNLIRRINGKILWTAFKQFSLTSWGRIKWEEVCCHQSIDYEEEIYDWLAKHHFKDRNIIILWGYGEQPALKTSLEHALNVIDDVTAVGSDTFMFSESGYVIEFFHDGDVTIGKSPFIERINK